MLSAKGAPRRSNLQGDLIVFTNPLADASGKVVGTLHVQCVTTAPSLNFLKSKLTCGGVMALRGGTMTLQAVTSPGGPHDVRCDHGRHRRLRQRARDVHLGREARRLDGHDHARAVRV